MQRNTAITSTDLDQTLQQAPDLSRLIQLFSNLQFT